jgi:hypothetical protein
MWHRSGDAAASLGFPSRGFRFPGETFFIAPTAATLEYAQLPLAAPAQLGA